MAVNPNDHQIQERAKLATQDEIMSKRKRTLDELEKKADQIQAEEQLWINEKKMFIEAEKRRKKTAKDLHDQRIEEMKRLEVKEREQRLQEIAQAEERAKEALMVSRRLRQVEDERIQEECDHLAKESQEQLRIQTEEERLRRLETQVFKRSLDTIRARFEEDHDKLIKEEIERKKKLIEQETELKQAQWRIDEEERSARFEAVLKQREEMLKNTTAQRTEGLIDDSLMNFMIERDNKLLELEREKRLRNIEQEKILMEEAEAITISQTKDFERKAQEPRINEALQSLKTLELERAVTREELLTKELNEITAESIRRQRRTKEAYR